MPGILFAAMHAPTPVPQTSTPRSARPSRTRAQTAWAISGKSTGSGACVPTSSTSCPQVRNVATSDPLRTYPAWSPPITRRITSSVRCRRRARAHPITRTSHVLTAPRIPAAPSPPHDPYRVRYVRKLVPRSRFRSGWGQSERRSALLGRSPRRAASRFSAILPPSERRRDGDPRPQARAGRR